MTALDLRGDTMTTYDTEYSTSEGYATATIGGHQLTAFHWCEHSLARQYGEQFPPSEGRWGDNDGVTGWLYDTGVSYRSPEADTLRPAWEAWVETLDATRMSHTSTCDDCLVEARAWDIEAMIPEVVEAVMATADFSATDWADVVVGEVRDDLTGLARAAIADGPWRTELGDEADNRADVGKIRSWLADYLELVIEESGEEE